MSDAGPGFLGRWARRKAAARPALAPAVPAEAEPVPVLPPVESLGAGSDFAAFLQKGVAAEIQRQALAVAWRSDPGIAAFRGMADYDWDFNAPTYGKLWASDDVGKLLRAVLDPPAEEAPPAEPLVASMAPLPAPGPAPPQDVAADPQTERSDEALPVPRRHGSAMPA